MKNFEEIIKSIIKKSGGSSDKINLSDFMEQLNHCFSFADQNYWLGITIIKNPLDLAILQQIMFEKRPDTIIECGTAYGGSACFMAGMMDLMQIDGKVITIDNEPNQMEISHKTDLIRLDGKIVSLDVQELKKADHPKIISLHSPCLSAEIPPVSDKTMVILDCDHSSQHVYQELVRFSELVGIGQYIIVEDTDAADKENGPAAAVKKFLKENNSFIVDRNREKYGISSNIGGNLLRIS